jgi:hypothetical protein
VKKILNIFKCRNLFLYLLIGNIYSTHKRVDHKPVEELVFHIGNDKVPHVYYVNNNAFIPRNIKSDTNSIGEFISIFNKYGSKEIIFSKGLTLVFDKILKNSLAIKNLDHNLQISRCLLFSLKETQEYKSLIKSLCEMKAIIPLKLVKEISTPQIIEEFFFQKEKEKHELLEKLGLKVEPITSIATELISIAAINMVIKVSNCTYFSCLIRCFGQIFFHSEFKTFITWRCVKEVSSLLEEIKNTIKIENKIEYSKENCNLNGYLLLPKDLTFAIQHYNNIETTENNQYYHEANIWEHFQQCSIYLPNRDNCIGILRSCCWINKNLPQVALNKTLELEILLSQINAKDINPVLCKSFLCHYQKTITDTRLEEDIFIKNYLKYSPYICEYKTFIVNTLKELSITNKNNTKNHDNIEKKKNFIEKKLEDLRKFISKDSENENFNPRSELIVHCIIESLNNKNNSLCKGVECLLKIEKSFFELMLELSQLIESYYYLVGLQSYQKRYSPLMELMNDFLLKLQMAEFHENIREIEKEANAIHTINKKYNLNSMKNYINNTEMTKKYNNWGKSSTIMRIANELQDISNSLRELDEAIIDIQDTHAIVARALDKKIPIYYGDIFYRITTYIENHKY